MLRYSNHNHSRQVAGHVTNSQSMMPVATDCDVRMARACIRSSMMGK